MRSQDIDIEIVETDGERNFLNSRDIVSVSKQSDEFTLIQLRGEGDLWIRDNEEHSIYTQLVNILKKDPVIVIEPRESTEVDDESIDDFIDLEADLRA